MQTTQYIIIGITIGIVVLLFIGVIIISLVIDYRKRQKKNYVEKQIMQQQFQSELIKTEFEVQEQTRKNVATDLHDNIGQLLSLTNVTLASININDKEKAEQKLSDTQNLVSRSIKELRQLSKIIHGEQLIQQGLVQTIQQEINWLERNGHYTVTFQHQIENLTNANADKDLFLYRLLQEAINNIIKHAGANTINIHLQYQPPHLQLTISDNGIGFSAEEKSKGMGLQNMQRRISLLNGAMYIKSEENKGSSIEFIIPYP